MEHIEHWFDLYGYYVLFFGLLLEFIALPFPGETTMAYAGYLSFTGQLHWVWNFVFALSGTTIGMTITYFVGYKLGMPFLERYGKWVFLSPAKILRTKHWFEKYGNKLLFIAYFIPGVRHFTGYFSGIVRMPFRTFAIYAYTGATFWVVFFTGLGHVFGPQWEEIFTQFHRYSVIFIIVAATLITAYLVFRFRKPLRQFIGHLYRADRFTRSNISFFVYLITMLSLISMTVAMIILDIDPF